MLEIQQIHTVLSPEKKGSANMLFDKTSSEISILVFKAWFS